MRHTPRSIFPGSISARAIVIGALTIATGLFAGVQPGYAQAYAHPLAPWGSTRDTVVARLQRSGFTITWENQDGLVGLASPPVHMIVTFDGDRLVGVTETQRPLSSREAARRFDALGDSLQRALGAPGATEVNNPHSNERSWKHPTSGETIQLVDYRGNRVSPFVSLRRMSPDYDRWLRNPSRPRAPARVSSPPPRADTAVTAARVRAYENAAISSFPDLVTNTRKAGLTGLALINRAEFVRAVERVYPPRLRDAGVGGEVQVIFVVDSAGRVVNPEVLWSADESLARAAISVIQSARFNPATMNGRAQPAIGLLPIVFSPDVRLRLPE